MRLQTLPIIIILLCGGCAQQNKEPCPEQTAEQTLLKTGLAAYMVSQGYYIEGCL